MIKDEDIDNLIDELKYYIVLVIRNENDAHVESCLEQYKQREILKASLIKLVNPK